MLYISTLDHIRLIKQDAIYPEPEPQVINVSLVFEDSKNEVSLGDFKIRWPELDRYNAGFINGKHI